MESNLTHATKQPIDILVLTYNRLRYFKTFVKFLYLSTDYPFRLIVIDNGSTDGTREYIVELRKQGKIWKYLFNEKNLPLAAAFTEGFKLVESELFITAPDDIIPPLGKKPSWLEIFVAKMDQDEMAGCINLIGSRCVYDKFVKRYG